MEFLQKENTVYENPTKKIHVHVHFLAWKFKHFAAKRKEILGGIFSNCMTLTFQSHKYCPMIMHFLLCIII